MNRPWLQFYTRDWLDSKELRRCSAESRAVLADLMCLAHEGEPYGYLSDKVGPLTDEYMASRCVIPVARFRRTVIELVKHERIHEADSTYFIRRMVDDEKLRLCRAEGGYKSKGNPKLTDAYNSPGFLYAMRRSSDGAVKIGIAINPTNRLYKIRSSIKTDEIELLHSWPVDDMGKAEASAHLQFAEARVIGEWFALTDEDLSTLNLTLKGRTPDKVIGDPRAGADVRSDSDSGSSSVSSTTDKSENEEVKKVLRPSHGSRFSLESVPDEWLTYPIEKFGWDKSKALDVFESFRLYWSAEAGQKARKANWLSAWQLWCRKERAPRSGVLMFEPKPSATDRALAVVKTRLMAGERPI